MFKTLKKSDVENSISNKILKYNMDCYNLQLAIINAKEESGNELSKGKREELLQEKYDLGILLDEILEDEYFMFRGHLYETTDELIESFFALAI